MFNYWYGNLFEKVTPSLINDGDIHFIIHGCNAQGRMGSGFAKELRERYPGAYTAYHDEYVRNNNRLILGTVVNYPVSESLIISNAITQDFYGYDGKKYVSYDAIDDVFASLNNTAKVLKELGSVHEVYFHFPKIGSALGGGHWDVIEQIIDFRVTDAIKNLYEMR